ncbi:MAG: asparagine synthase (glutamine-hydrolyzing) [Gaiellaceae bacterium]
MCGICGFVAARDAAPPARSRVEQATSALAHRGPDGSGVYVTDSVGLGHTRLSIIDIEGGAQPIYNEDRTILTVYNGEIWNYLDLRRELERAGHRFHTLTDGEVLVHGYEEWADDLLPRLDGMFAFALWDEPRQRLLLARDRVGKKPLYVAQGDGGLAFGSDIRSVLLVTGRRPELAEDRVPEYLFQRYVTAPATLVRGVEKLEPGSLLVYDRTRISRRRYWQLEPATLSPLDPRDLRSLLRDAVRRRLMSDVPLGVLLSGGVDSSAVLGLMHEAGAERVSTFTIGFRDRVYDERSLARLVSRRYGSDHHEVVVEPHDFARALPRLSWYRDEPIAEPSEVPLLLLAELAGRHVKVVLTGDGGDEVFGGYPKYRAERLLRAGGPASATALRLAVRALSTRRSHRRLDRAIETMRIRDPLLRWASWFRTFSPAELGRLLDRRVPVEMLTEPLRRALEPYSNLDPGRQMLVGDFLTYLPDNMLIRSDKVLMAASVEGRMPLLDHNVVERVANVPASARSGLREAKAVFRAAVRDLLPPELLNQPKRGFPVPVVSFLSSGPGNVLPSLVLSDRALDRGLVKHDEVASIVARGEDLKLFTLASLELWLRANVDQVTAEPPSALELLGDEAPTATVVAGS